MGGSKKVTIGYKYSIGMDIVPSFSVDRITKIIAGERIAWEGNVTSSTRIFINKPELFGGEKKEGGIVGAIDIDFGDQSQVANSYLQSQLGENIPAFRGLLSIVLNKVYLTAMTQQIKPWWFELWRSAAPGWYDATSTIVGQGNPGDEDYIPGGSTPGSHIIYEALTNNQWGLGLSQSLLNAQSFIDSADILFSENFGLSMIFARQTSVENFIGIVLPHIGGILYTDRRTGLFTLKLIRKVSQQEIDNAKVFNESNTIKLNSFDRPSFAEIVNEVVLTYRPQSAVQDSVVAVQDLSAVSAELGTISQKVDFSGVDNQTIASRVAIRELKQISTPLATAKITVNRDGWDINPGDIIKFSWDVLGIENIILRVFAVSYGSYLDNKIIITTTEDIFSVDSNSYLGSQGSQWTDPVQEPLPAVYQAAFDIPYYEIDTDFTQGAALEVTDSSSYLQFAAQKPYLLASPSYQLWTSSLETPDSSYEFAGDSSYAPIAQLLNGLSKQDSDFLLYNLSPDVGLVEIGSYAYIGNETVRIDALDPSTGAITVGRGALDTIPVEHAVDEIITFIADNFLSSEVEYTSSEIIYSKPLVQTSIGLQTLASSVATEFEFFNRQSRPYPAAQVKLKTENNQTGTYFPEVVNALQGTELLFKHQDRILQAVEIDDWYSSNSSVPEIGVKYEFSFLNENGIQEFSSIEDLSGDQNPSFNYTVAQEKDNSGLSILPSGRVLTTSGLALDNTNIAWPSMRSNLISTGTGYGFRGLGSDWGAIALLENNNIVQSAFINGTNGNLSIRSESYNSFQQKQQDINPLSLRDDVVYITSDQVGTQKSWAVVVPSLVNPDNNKNSVPLQSMALTDHRDNPGNFVFATTNYLKISFVADGKSAIKNIWKLSQNILFYPKTTMSTSGSTVEPVKRVSSEFLLSPVDLLDSSDQNISDYGWTGLFESADDKTPFRGNLFGNMIYMTYTGAGVPGSTWSTGSQNLNIKNILNSDISEINPGARLMSYVHVNPSSTVLDDPIRTDSRILYADRSNVADTQGIEWATGSLNFNVINSIDGSIISEVITTIMLRSMCVNWIDEFVYVLGFDEVVYKLNYSGAIQESLQYPTPNINAYDADIKVSSNKVYIFDFKVQEVYSNDLDLSGPWNLEPTESRKLYPYSQGQNSEQVYEWAASVRPDREGFYNQFTDNSEHLLYTSDGGVSPNTPYEEPMQNTSLTAQVQAVRGSIDGWQTFSHTIERSGYGYNYGKYYGK